MTTIYIGSSNVERFADIIEKETRKSLVVHKCTHLDGFVARMENLKETDRRIIISVIENFLCDEVNDSVTKGDIEKAIEKTLTAFTKVVGETAARLPTTKFAIIEPIERPAIGWFTSGLKDITMEYSRLINGLSLTNVMIIKKVDLPVQTFDEQKIHLTPASGKKFVEATIFYAGNFFEAVVVDLASSEVPMDVAGDANNIKYQVKPENVSRI